MIAVNRVRHEPGRPQGLDQSRLRIQGRHRHLHVDHVLGRQSGDRCGADVVDPQGEWPQGPPDVGRDGHEFARPVGIVGDDPGQGHSE